MQAAAAGVIRSPAMTTGTAGGQLTQASARIRPTALSAGRVSCGESMASRTDRTFSGTGSGGGVSFSPSRRGTARRAYSRRCQASSVFSAEGMSTR